MCGWGHSCRLFFRGVVLNSRCSGVDFDAVCGVAPPSPTESIIMPSFCFLRRTPSFICGELHTSVWRCPRCVWRHSVCLRVTSLRHANLALPHLVLEGYRMLSHVGRKFPAAMEDNWDVMWCHCMLSFLGLWLLHMGYIRRTPGVILAPFSLRTIPCSNDIVR